MDIIEIFFEETRGTATLIESSGWHSRWKIVFEDKYLIIDHSYIKAKTYTLVEHSDNLDVDKALGQMTNVMWQIDKSIKANKPRPPKCYR